MSISAEQASRIEAKLDQLVGDVSTLKTDVVDLRVHMGVLHESAIDQIKLLAEGQQALREEVGRDLAALREAFEGRIRPLEDTVREHSAELKRRR